MNRLDRFIVNTATNLLEGVLTVGTGLVYAQMFLFGALLVGGLVLALAFVAKAFLAGA